MSNQPEEQGANESDSEKRHKQIEALAKAADEIGLTPAEFGEVVLEFTAMFGANLYDQKGSAAVFYFSDQKSAVRVTVERLDQAVSLEMGDESKPVYPH